MLRSATRSSLSNPRRVFQVQALLSEIDGTKTQIEKLEGEIGIFFSDEDKIFARNSLKTRVDNLLNQLMKRGSCLSTVHYYR